MRSSILPLIASMHASSGVSSTSNPRATCGDGGGGGEGCGMRGNGEEAVGVRVEGGAGCGDEARRWKRGSSLA
eukprot:64370-Prymnesium_polylepis.1